jgi:hypothetical protein
MNQLTYPNILNLYINQTWSIKLGVQPYTSLIILEPNLPNF